MNRAELSEDETQAQKMDAKERKIREKEETYHAQALHHPIHLPPPPDVLYPRKLIEPIVEPIADIAPRQTPVLPFERFKVELKDASTRAIREKGGSVELGKDRLRRVGRVGRGVNGRKRAGIGEGRLIWVVGQGGLGLKLLLLLLLFEEGLLSLEMGWEDVASGLGLGRLRGDGETVQGRLWLLLLLLGHLLLAIGRRRRSRTSRRSVLSRQDVGVEGSWEGSDCEKDASEGRAVAMQAGKEREGYLLILADVATGVFVAPRPWPTIVALTGAGFLREETKMNVEVSSRLTLRLWERYELT